MSVVRLRRPGPDSAASKGRVAAVRWLVLRRSAQALFLALFVGGPWFGLWIAKGTLASSLTLDFLPLTDPFILLQSAAAGHVPERAALIGAAIVLVGYAVLGGRMYCSWVCPINPIADAAHWLRQRLGLVGTLTINRNTRIWVMGGALLASAAGGIVAWELVNPITLLSRALVFGAAAAGTLTWGILLAVFLFDLVIASRGWCGHVCPVGAFYGLVGSVSLLKVSAQRRAACDDCLDCYKVCPEPHVIAPALKGAERGLGPVVLSRDCTNCGRCIDVCPKDVFAFDHRFNNPTYATGG